MSAGGHEQRNANWASPRIRFNVVPGVKNQAQLYELMSFFRLCQGKAFGFRFKDWSDYQGMYEQIGISDGQNLRYQLCKWYGVQETGMMKLHGNGRVNQGDGGNEEYANEKNTKYARKRLIHKPQLGSVKIFCDGSELDRTKYIVDYSNGSVVLDEVSEAGVKIAADFMFDVPVRFDIDYLPIKVEGSGLYIHAEIPLVELRIMS